MAVKVGSFTKSTDAAPVDQAVTGIGFTPEALFLFTVGGLSAGTQIDGFFVGWGMTAGASASGSVAASGEDTNTDTINASHRAAAKALTIVQYGESLLAECDLKTFDADGFTVTWTTNNSSAYIVHYIALAGPNLTNVALVNWQAPTTAGNRAVTGVGFQPDCVLHLMTYTASQASAADANICLGAMTTAAQFAHGPGLKDGSNTEYQQEVSEDSYCLYINDIGTFSEARAEYVSMDADGFTVNFIEEFNVQHQIFSLCLKGGSYYIGSLTTPVATGDQAITGVGFQPEGVLYANASGITTDFDAGLSQGIGATDGTAEGSAWLYSQYSTANEDVHAMSKTDKVIVGSPTNSATIAVEADIKSLDADGFTLTWTTTTNGYHAFFLAMALGVLSAKARSQVVWIG